MEEYHKIQSIFKRDEKTHKFIDGAWALPEFEYLKDNTWVYTEKIDGTNVRVSWENNGVDWHLKFGGRTDNAQMPTFLYQKLCDIFGAFKEPFWEEHFPDGVTLYGEGYGAKIQKGGGNYSPDGVEFILFDVKIGDWWLRRDDVGGIAQNLGIKVVPCLGEGTIGNAILEVENGLMSAFGNFQAEGMVLRPKVELQTRSGHRIIAKLKGRDF